MQLDKKGALALGITVFLAIVATAVLHAFRFSSGDIDTYLPFILHAHDPELFTKDLLLGTLSSHPVYIWKVMAVFLEWISPAVLIRIAFLTQTFIIALSALFFFRRFFGTSRAWMLFLCVLALPVSCAGYGMFGLNPYGYFHAGALAFGTVLAAYSLLDSRHWIAGGIITGSLFLFHPVTAMYAAGFFFIKLLADLIRKEHCWQMAVGALLLVVVALPSLLPAFHSVFASPTSTIDPDFWRKLARLRMNHGYFISAWVPDRFIQIAACFSALCFLFRKHPSFTRLLPIIIVVAIGLFVAALADMLSIRFFLRLQLGRCSYFIYFLTLAFAVDALTGSITRAYDRATRIRWSISGALVLVFSGGSVLVSQPAPIKKVIIVLLAASAVIAVLRPFVKIHQGFFFGALALMIPLASFGHMKGSFLWTSARELRDPWIEMSTSCKSLVPRDSVVMIPLLRQDFRPFSYRASYCTWKDCAPHLFCDSTLGLWWERAQKFGVTLLTKKSELSGLYHKHALAVARSEGIRFVVFEKTMAETGSPLLFENSGFGLIDLSLWKPEDSLGIPRLCKK